MLEYFRCLDTLCDGWNACDNFIDTRVIANNNISTPITNEQYWPTSTSTGNTFKYKLKRFFNESGNFSRVYKQKGYGNEKDFVNWMLLPPTEPRSLIFRQKKIIFTYNFKPKHWYDKVRKTFNMRHIADISHCHIDLKSGAQFQWQAGRLCEKQRKN